MRLVYRCWLTLVLISCLTGAAYCAEPLELAFAAPHVELYAADPAAIQGLESCVERSGIKPSALFCREDGLLTTRLIFRKRQPSRWRRRFAEAAIGPA